MSKLLYRVDEAAEILAISKSQIRKLIDEGALTGHNDNPGRKGLRVTAASIQAYYDKHQLLEG